MFQEFIPNFSFVERGRVLTAASVLVAPERTRQENSLDLCKNPKPR